MSDETGHEARKKRWVREVRQMTLRAWESGWDAHESFAHLSKTDATTNKETAMPEPTKKTWLVTTKDFAEIEVCAESSDNIEGGLYFRIGDEVVAEFPNGTWLRSLMEPRPEVVAVKIGEHDVATLRRELDKATRGRHVR